MPCSSAACQKLHVRAEVADAFAGAGIAMTCCHDLAEARRFIARYPGRTYRIMIAWPDRNATIIEAGRQGQLHLFRP